MFLRLVLPLLLLCSVSALAAETPAARGSLPAVAIVIDDLGNSHDLDVRAVDLPGPVTCAFLPHTPYAARLARRAHRAGKEVMLHLPMQAVDGQRLGPGGLTLHMTQTEFLHSLRDSLAAIPYVSGVNNHMGSLLTRHPGHMDWLMQALHQTGSLYFVDSRTTRATVAQMVAHEDGVPNTRRDVFLDNVAEDAAVAAQLRALIAKARHRGAALAIGHPHPATLRVLARVLPTLRQAGVRLVPVSELIRIEQERGRPQRWRVSLSPSPRAVKSSRR